MKLIYNQNNLISIEKNNNVFKKDIEVFHKILYNKYFKFLDPFHKKVFLRKYNSFMKFYFNFLDTIKKILN